MKDVKKMDQIFEFDRLRDSHLKKTVEDLKNQIEAMDEAIRDSNWRKTKGYICNGKVKRTIWTSEGVLTYERTKFKRKVGKHWRTTFLVDDYFEIQKYSKVSYEFKAKILEKVAKNYKYEQIVDAFPRLPLNKSTITRIIAKNDFADLNEWDLTANYQIPKNSSNFDTIYISTDDCFLNLKENGVGVKYRVRLAILYQGLSRIPDDRNSKLINKRIVYKLEKVKSITKNSVISFSNLIREKIKEFYGEKHWKLVVSGDGDNYIKGIAEELDAEIVLDWFHLKMKLKKCFHFTRYKKDPKQVTLFQQIADFLKDHPIAAINDFLKPLLESDFLKKDETKDLIRYIKNNLEGIKSYQKDWYIGCATESNVYHFVKSISNSKSYSVSTFRNLLALRVGWIDTLKPIDLWHQEVEEKVDQNIDLKRWPVINKEEDKIQRGFLPIFNAPKSSGIADILKKVINDQV